MEANLDIIGWFGVRPSAWNLQNPFALTATPSLLAVMYYCIQNQAFLNVKKIGKRLFFVSFSRSFLLIQPYVMTELTFLTSILAFFAASLLVSEVQHHTFLSKAPSRKMLLKVCAISLHINIPLYKQGWLATSSAARNLLYNDELLVKNV